MRLLNDVLTHDTLYIVVREHLEHNGAPGTYSVSMKVWAGILHGISNTIRRENFEAD
jgi:hypothetical protein